MVKIMTIFCVTLLKLLGISLDSPELLRVRKLDGVHLIFNLEAGSLLPLAIR